MKLFKVHKDIEIEKRFGNIRITSIKYSKPIENSDKWEHYTEVSCWYNNDCENCPCGWENISYEGECDDCELCYKQGNNGERIESTKIAIQALEKQIPKKVQLRHVRKFDGFDDGECPTCGLNVSRDCDGTDVM